jgi:hypothetical protein
MDGIAIGPNQRAGKAREALHENRVSSSNLKGSRQFGISASHATDFFPDVAVEPFPNVDRTSNKRTSTTNYGVGREIYLKASIQERTISNDE